MQATTSDRLASDLVALWELLTEGSIPEIYAVLEELDIGLTQFKILHALKSGEDTCLKDLGTHLGLSLPGASRSVEHLLRRGWLERWEDPDDRRVKRLRLTGEGRAVLARVAGARHAGLERFAASIPEAERRALSAALEPIIARPTQEGPAS